MHDRRRRTWTAGPTLYCNQVRTYDRETVPPICPGGAYAKNSPSNPHEPPPFEISTSWKGQEKLSADMRVCVNLNVGFKQLAIEKTSTETSCKSKVLAE